MAGRISRGWIVIFMVFSFAAVAAVLGGVRMSQKMQAAAQGEGGTALSRIAPGSNTKVVMEITESDSNTIRGKLLEPTGSDSYRRTDTDVRTYFDGNTKIVMGSEAEIRPGAVLHLSGALTEHREIQARQIVILTGYVKVK